MSGLVVRILGSAGSKVLSKVFLVFLAAFAVMMVRRGIAAALSAGA